MRNTLSLDKRIDELVRQKFKHCKCNPCTCSEKTKDQYFQELKDVLKRFNIEKFAFYSIKSATEK